LGKDLVLELQDQFPSLARRPRLVAQGNSSRTSSVASPRCTLPGNQGIGPSGPPARRGAEADQLRPEGPGRPVDLGPWDLYDTRVPGMRRRIRQCSRSHWRSAVRSGAETISAVREQLDGLLTGCLPAKATSAPPDLPHGRRGSGRPRTG
jgi:hypothetical protein